MKYQLLSDRIAERLAIVGKKERGACLEAGLSPDAVRNFREKDHAPKVETICALARVLDCPPEYLLNALCPDVRVEPAAGVDRDLLADAIVAFEDRLRELRRQDLPARERAVGIVQLYEFLIRKRPNEGELAAWAEGYLRRDP